MQIRQSSCADPIEESLIPVDAAKNAIFAAITPLPGRQRLCIENALGRTLATDVIATADVPAQTNSAVDGYAINSQDIVSAATHKKQFNLLGSALAGVPFTGNYEVNGCVHIMTGAAIPSGFDTVIMQEHVQVQGLNIVIDRQHEPGQNVRKAGENLKCGDSVLPAGRLITVADIGLLASMGITEVDVRRKLRIAIASTGDEILDLGESNESLGVYDSNRYMLLAALDRPDIELIDLGILPDRADTIQTSFSGAATHADMIISSGGVSVGTADHTKTALDAVGQINFWKVAIKPGRPLAFGKIDESVFFGLPGNPIAVLITFYLFVLPAIETLLGITEKPIVARFQARATQAIRKKSGRTEIQRGIINRMENGEWQVATTGKQGSGILRSMSLANALIILDHDSGNVEPGDWVDVLPLSSL